MSGNSSEFSLDTDLEITLSELEYLEAKYNAERSRGQISEDTQFVYAWALIRSKFKDDRLMGIEIFKTILEEFPHRKRECMFYLASAYYKIGDFGTALTFASELSRSEPNNQQVAALKQKIESKMTKDGIIGLALVGGLAAATAGLLIAAFRSRK